MVKSTEDKPKEEDLGAHGLFSLEKKRLKGNLIVQLPRVGKRRGRH